MTPGALLFAITLVLRSGDRLPVDGSVKEANGAYTFRSGGTLYSMPKEEVVRIEEDTPPSTSGKTVTAAYAPVLKLRVSEEERKRLIEKLEKNHSGTPPPPIAAVPEDPKSASRPRRDPNAHREQERAYEQAIASAKQNLAAAEDGAAAIERKIINLIGMGYGPDSFTYDSLQLERAKAAIPRARAEIERAEKAFVEFREKARKSGLRPE